MARPLVIVESPAKARTIKGFLGDGYVVEASVGHVRDLPGSAAEVPADMKGEKWAKLGVDVLHDFAPLYVVPEEKRAQVAKLRGLLKDASELLLATDEDREGESISWHLREVLRPRVPVKRLVFHEITPEAIRAALASPRQIDEDLVRAQEARRIVDRLYGYEVSPLLWKKVRPKLSAGRVQSVAVRLVVDRERARMAFRASTWWDVEAAFSSTKGPLGATLAEVDGRRVASGRDFDEHTGALKSRDVLLLDEASANRLAAELVGRSGVVTRVERKPYRDRPAPPFTTSTLQQEANRKLRWTAKLTMKVAQTLYENGWITYMRTDSVALSDQAIAAARGLITSLYGADHLPKEPRRYKSTAKNAQEAHEAIRPAGARFRAIEEARSTLEPDQAKLYELIWKRTVACQMADAEGDLLSIAADVRGAASVATFSASGKTIRFPGFRRAYVEGSDDPDAELADQEKLLPPLVVGDAVKAEKLVPKGHTTQPPARLTEATLVKELEARGVGRPSTYAEILGKIIERDYVFKRGNALVPTFVAFSVTGLLERHLTDLIDYEFTARIEDELDHVALGKKPWVETLRRFYLGDAGLRSLLGRAESTVDPREVCTIPIGRHGDVDIVVRVGRYGPFLAAGDQTADVPEDTAPEDATVEWAWARLAGKAQGPRSLGEHPSGQPVFLLDGRFGPYLQLGEATDGVKPPRASLLPGMKPDTVDLPTAIALLGLPRTLGASNGEDVVAANGRFGPYVRRGKETRTVPRTLSILTISLAEAERLFAEPRRPTRGAVEPLRELGNDPQSGGAIRLMKGRFGPYVTDGTTNATLPRGTSPEALTPEAAAELLAVKRAAGPPVKRGGAKGAARRGRGAAAASADTAPASRPKAGAAKASGKGARAAAPSEAPSAGRKATAKAAGSSAKAAKAGGAAAKSTGSTTRSADAKAPAQPAKSTKKAAPAPKGSTAAASKSGAKAGAKAGAKGAPAKAAQAPGPPPNLQPIKTVKYRPGDPPPPERR